MSEQPLLIQCPHCHAPVQVSPAYAGGPLVCPNGQCGQSFQAAPPEAIPVSAPAAAAAPVNPPARAVPAADAPENEVARVQLRMVRRYPFRFAGYVAGIVA